MAQLENLPPELVTVLGSWVDYNDIENLCLLSSRLANICQEKQFWITLIQYIRPWWRDLQPYSLFQLERLFQKLTSGGKLYIWGNNRFTEVIEIHPVLLVTEVPVIQISLSSTHMGYITNDGKAYIRAIGEKAQSLGKIDEIADIIQISCGYNFIGLLTQSGQVYTFGDNTAGQLGQRGEDESYPTLVNTLSGIRIVQISCGTTHMGALDGNGNVYLWGSEQYGKLGNGGSKDIQRLPVLIPGINNIKQIICSTNSTLLLSDTGKVYTCGRNEFGQLGLGSKENIYEPTEITGLPHIVQVQAGFSHSVFLSREGEVYVCGDNDNGQLGTSDMRRRYVPEQIRGLPPIHQIACGHIHTAAITADQHLYIWGYNRNEVLGTESPQMIITTPTLVPLTGVRDVSCGYMYTAALAKN